MNFSELCDEVHVITNRHDLISETKLAVRKSTVKMHSIDYFNRDFVEVPLTPATAAAIITVDINSNLPLMRAVTFIQDQSSGIVKFFNYIDPQSLFDEYNEQRTNCWYQAGQTINIKSSTIITQFLVGYYKNPTITPEGSYSSWIAVEQPYAIIEDAAATIFDMLGMKDKVALYQRRSAENIALLRQNYLESVAR